MQLDPLPATPSPVAGRQARARPGPASGQAAASCMQRSRRTATPARLPIGPPARPFRPTHRQQQHVVLHAEGVVLRGVPRALARPADLRSSVERAAEQEEHARSTTASPRSGGPPPATQLATAACSTLQPAAVHTRDSVHAGFPGKGLHGLQVGAQHKLRPAPLSPFAWHLAYPTRSHQPLLPTPPPPPRLMTPPCLHTRPPTRSPRPPHKTP